VTTWGERLPLASVHSPSPFRVGKYSVEVENLETVSLYLIDLLNNGQRNFLIDEIGKMEFFSRTFRFFLEKAFSTTEVNVLATISRTDFHPLLRSLKGKATYLMELTRSNFPRVLEEITNLLKNLPSE
jgi:nucleoside-triphosphatase